MAAFYLPVSRAWELMLGELLAYWEMKTERNLLQRFPNSVALFGFALLIASFYGINKSSAFPGAIALMPAFGVFFILAAGQPAWLNRTLLSTRPAVWVGLISYPLYLWHWPLLSFLHIYGGTTYLTVVKAGLILASVLLAWLTFNFLEKPIRFGVLKKNAVYSLAATMATLLLFGVIIERGQIVQRIHDPLIAKVVRARNDWSIGEGLVRFQFEHEKFWRSRNGSDSSTVLFLGALPHGPVYAQNLQPPQREG